MSEKLNKPKHEDIVKQARFVGNEIGNKCTELDFGAGAEWMQEKYEAYLETKLVIYLDGLWNKVFKEIDDGLHDFQHGILRDEQLGNILNERKIYMTEAILNLLKSKGVGT